MIISGVVGFVVKSIACDGSGERALPPPSRNLEVIGSMLEQSCRGTLQQLKEKKKKKKKKHPEGCLYNLVTLIIYQIADNSGSVTQDRDRRKDRAKGGGEDGEMTRLLSTLPSLEDSALSLQESHLMNQQGEHTALLPSYWNKLILFSILSFRLSRRCAGLCS